MFLFVGFEQVNINWVFLEKITDQMLMYNATDVVLLNGYLRLGACSIITSSMRGGWVSAFFVMLRDGKQGE